MTSHNEDKGTYYTVCAMSLKSLNYKNTVKNNNNK